MCYLHYGYLYVLSRRVRCARTRECFCIEIVVSPLLHEGSTPPLYHINYVVFIPLSAPLHAIRIHSDAI